MTAAIGDELGRYDGTPLNKVGLSVWTGFPVGNWVGIAEEATRLVGTDDGKLVGKLVNVDIG